MGLFGFGKKKEEKVFAHLKGEFVKIEDVQDPVFSQKMMGDGFAINPSEGVLYAPVNGEIVNVFPTLHAVGIKSENGFEYLMHIGLDTVTLKGEGFKAFVKVGDQVKVGDKLIEFDLESIKEKVPSMVTPLVVTNLEGKSIKTLNTTNVEPGKTEVISVEL